jgi:hypothetical protein
VLRSAAVTPTRLLAVATLLACPIAGPAAAAEPSPANRAAIFKAAGFKAKGGQYVRCEEDPPTASYSPGRIELADLNGDGTFEAWVYESSVFCYGNTAESFVLLTRDAGGAWRKLAGDVGVPTPLATRRQGWPDVEVGGPGFGKFPVLRWNGRTYATTK